MRRLQWGESIAGPTSKSLSYDATYRHLSEKSKKEFLRIEKKWKKFSESNAEQVIHSEIETDKQHQNLVKLCAGAFAETDLSIKSGFQFYFAEPLHEFGQIREGNSSFDLFLFNDSSREAIFIECKTSIKEKAGPVMVSLMNSIHLVEDNLNYLSSIINVDIDKKLIEYVLCIYDKDINKLKDSFRSQKQKRKYDPKKIKLWIYRPLTGTIGLCPSHAHNNQILNDMLSSGFKKNSPRSRFDLPYCITTHNYRLIQLSIIGGCYARNLRNSVLDPKTIRLDDIFSTLEGKISLGASPEKRKQLIQKKIGEVVNYGERYQLLKRQNKEEIRLICKGDNTKSVSENIEKKFFKNWAKIESEQKAKEETVKEYNKKRKVKTFDQFKEFA
jgi:hypothetical protein